MKIESKKWKDYSEKCNHCCEINLIFNRKLSYKHFQTKSPNKTIEKLRRKTILSIGNIVNTTDFLPRYKRKFIPEKKKGFDPPLISSSSSSAKQWISEEKTKENSRLRIVCRYRLSSLHEKNWIRKIFFSKETKEISGRKSAADFRCVWERRPISEKEWESEKNNNETNA